MVLGLPNKAIVFIVFGLALLIPSRLSTASGAVRDVGSGFSSALSDIASPQITPTFNPTIGLQGNIGTGLVERFFNTGDDPTGDPTINWIPPGTGDPVYEPGPYGTFIKTKTPSAWELVTAEDSPYGD